MNNSLMSASSRTAFGLNEHMYLEEINERLLNTYLEDKNSSSFELYNSKPLSSADITSEEESDSSHKINGCKSTKNNNKKTIKCCKKKSDNDKSTKEPEKKQKSLYKTELCRNWEETNHCRYGIKCQYAHGATDLRELDRHPKYKTQKCRTFHQTGSCPYGTRCTFRHFNLPGDALEMKNRDKEEEEERQRQLNESKEQDWFVGTNSLVELPKRNFMSNFDAEDSLLPSNAESLLPHELLFDLESPEDEEKTPARCPLRDYVNLPSFSNFQVPHQTQMPQNTFFRPWLF